MGLSTPAMSHALARIRERLGDQILVRAGRGMLLTPRAELLKPRVHAIVSEARSTLEADVPFVASELRRTFVVHVTDYVLSILGVAFDQLVRKHAPLASIRFIPNSTDDPMLLREGRSDLAVGIYGALPQEMRSRVLLTDRFVCAVRKDHPLVGKRLTLAQFANLPHIQIAPRGTPGGYVDDVLIRSGHQRRVARAIPFFATALELCSQTDYIVTVSERIATKLAPGLGLKLLPVPLELAPYALSLVWHPRVDDDAGHRLLRELFVLATQQVARDRHENPQLRLAPLAVVAKKKDRKR
jgi:DNA-binding transcriptional LysR family regulator